MGRARTVALGAGLMGPLVLAAGVQETGEAGAAGPDWTTVLGPWEGTLPPPADEVVWREDLDAALAEARRDGRPLLVTLRCLPCKQCAAFDKDVLEGDPELDPLLARFVTVRLTSMIDVDQRLLPFPGYQDLDLSWWAYLLSPEGALYGVYGGRDAVSDATRISVPSLANTLRRVLAYHHDPRREGWGLDRPAPRLAGPSLTPTGLPGYREWSEFGPTDDQPAGCLHCHQVADILHLPGQRAGTLDKRVVFAPWPLPENLGLTLDRDDGLAITAVESGSPADRAGIEAGGRVAVAAGRLLFSQADLRGVLHRAPWGDQKLELITVGAAGVNEHTLVLKAGWKETDNSWRMSVTQGVVGAGLGFAWPLAVNAAERKRRGIAEDDMAVEPWLGRGRPKGAAYDAGLKAGDIIVAVDGESPNLVGRPLLDWWRRRYDPGDEVRLTVVDRQGKRRDVSYNLP